MDSQQFLDRLRRQFPGLGEALDEESIAGLLHLQVGEFARSTQGAIDAGDKAEVDRCFAVAEEAAREGSPDLQNAIGVAYLEHLNFQEGKVRREWAFAALPAGLRAMAASLGISAGYRRP